jgi:mannose-6-phosphate isomerase-like protein (cupin superfamily)
MHVMTPAQSPRYQRDGITSYLLVSERTCGSQKLSVTLVEMEPDGLQHIHTHEPEQTYTILEGSGLMTVGGEQQTVGPGDCIFIPSGAEHGLKNTGGTLLKYLSACSPSFTMQQCVDWWPLPSREESET